jgi:hypothetical protein
MASVGIASYRPASTTAILPKRRSYVGVIGLPEAELARHSKVHDQLQAGIERRDQELAPAADARDLSTREQLDSMKLARDRGDGIGPHTQNPAAGELGVELAADGFNLGQLRHEH